MGIRDEMPLLARHAGDWKGTYVFVDTEGHVLDRHTSHLTHAFPVEGAHPYLQINRYAWPDGRQEEHVFPAAYRDGRIWFDNPRIKGYAWEADPRTVILTWSYVNDPSKYLYEFIHLSDCGNHRTRVWHWYDGGEVYKRTLIKELRVTGDA